MAIGGFSVAVGIALEVWFASRASSAERKIRDWYALRVAELNLKAEQESNARAKLEQLTESLRRRSKKLSFLTKDRSLKNPTKFIEAMREFVGTRVRISASTEHNLDPESGELVSVLKRSLRSAGWEVMDPVSRLRLTKLSPIEEGVHIEYSPIDWFTEPPLRCVVAGCAVADWLNRERIATAIAPVHNRPTDDVVIITVGPKPSTIRMMNELRSRGNWRFWRGLTGCPPDYERISPEDVQLIHGLLVRTNSSEARFLAAVKAKSVEDIRQVQVHRAFQLLREKERGQFQ